MENTASIRVGLGVLEAEVAGSEAFVIENGVPLLERFSNLAESLQDASSLLDTGNADDGSSRRQLDHVTGDIFHVNGDSVKVLASIPGSPGAEQHVNAALLYILAVELKGGKEGRYSSIRALCKEHGIGLSHFAKNIRKEKSLFIVSGAGKGKDPVVQLTNPGRSRARELAGKLQAA